MIREALELIHREVPFLQTVTMAVETIVDQKRLDLTSVRFVGMGCSAENEGGNVSEKTQNIDGLYDLICAELSFFANFESH